MPVWELRKYSPPPPTDPDDALAERVRRAVEFGDVDAPNQRQIAEWLGLPESRRRTLRRVLRKMTSQGQLEELPSLHLLNDETQVRTGGTTGYRYRLPAT